MSGADAVHRAVSAGGTTEQLRQRNLSVALGLLHRESAMSRADITRALGMNRSTTAAVVADLEALGLVHEALPDSGTSRAGRPSGVVTPDEDVVAIAVNPEVDAVHVGLVGFGGRVVKHARIEASAQDVPAVVSLASATIAGLLADAERRFRVLGVGLAVPGQVRLADGQVRAATHLGWHEQPLAAMIAASTGYRVWAANAATLAMRSESMFGAGRDLDDFVYIIGGASGIGGGAVVGGRLLTGASGYAGEFGHTQVLSQGSPCHCGASGCLEAEVDQQTLLDAVGLAPAQASQLAERLRSSTDRRVRALVEQKIELLSVAVRNAVNLFNPEAVVLSGFLSALHQASPRDLAAAAIGAARERVRIVDATLGAEQLMIGAAELVFSELVADPGGFMTGE